MNPDLLLQHFDRICEAPNAIPRLRQLILDLAVRGKLVPHDPNEESADKIVSRIEIERKRLVSTGEIKKLEPVAPITATDIRFELPVGWSIARMGWLARKLGAGSTPLGGKSVYVLDGVPFLRSQNVYNGGLRLDDVARISTGTHQRMSGTHVRPDDVLLNITGASIGRCAVVPESLIEANVSQHVAIIRLFSPEIREFIHLSLISPLFQELIDDVQVGVSREGLSMQRLREFVMPLPPLAEQDRIVARVDELMALCDRLEVAQAYREEIRTRMTASSLRRLSEPAERAVFTEHVQFCLTQLPRLTARQDQISQLRQTVLDLAVRGKLVPQDPVNELAISKQYQTTLSRDVASRDGNLPMVSVKSDSPLGWLRLPLGDVIRELQTGPFGSSLHQSDYVVGGVPVINPASIKDGRLIPIDSMAVGNETLQRLATFKLKVNDIVMARRGEMGRCAVVTAAEDGWLCGTGCLVLRLPESVDPQFLAMLIGSPHVREYLMGSAVGTTMQNLNQRILLGLVIGLPPLAEQHQIVAKVDGLMSLCDLLEAKQALERDEGERLLEAVVARVVG